MSSRNVPAKGKGTLGTNVWEWFQAAKGEKSGEFVRTVTTAQWHYSMNRRQRRRAAAEKRGKV
jgi:hypothetical protein